MSNAVITYNAFANLGYAFVRYGAGDGADLYRDHGDKGWKPWDPKFVLPFPPQPSSPRQAVRKVDVPDDAADCVLEVYELDAAGAPTAVLGGVAIAGPPAVAPAVAGPISSVVVTIK